MTSTRTIKTTQRYAAASPFGPAAALGFLCWALVVAALVFAVVRIFGLERTWLVTVVMAFTPYVAVLSLIPLGFAIVLRRWRAAVVALVATFALVSVVVPRVVGSADAARGPTLRVMSSNMYIGTADVQDILALATKNDDRRAGAAGIHDTGSGAVRRRRHRRVVPVFGAGAAARTRRLGDLFEVSAERHRIHRAAIGSSRRTRPCTCRVRFQ